MGGFPKNRGTVLKGPSKGILFYLGSKRGTPMLGNTHIQDPRVMLAIFPNLGHVAAYLEAEGAARTLERRGW